MIRVNDNTMAANGTHLQGEFPQAVSTNDLIEILGEPERGHYEDKVTREWTIEDTDAGVVATIYDWKEYREYSDDEVIYWHIGGHNQEAVNLVISILTGNKKINVSQIES